MGDLGATYSNCDENCTILYYIQRAIEKDLGSRDLTFPDESIFDNHITKVDDQFLVDSWFYSIDTTGDTLHRNYTCQVVYNTKKVRYDVGSLSIHEPEKSSIPDATGSNFIDLGPVLKFQFFERLESGWNDSGNNRSLSEKGFKLESNEEFENGKKFVYKHSESAEIMEIHNYEFPDGESSFTAEYQLSSEKRKDSLVNSLSSSTYEYSNKKGLYERNEGTYAERSFTIEEKENGHLIRYYHRVGKELSTPVLPDSILTPL